MKECALEKAEMRRLLGGKVCSGNGLRLSAGRQSSDLEEPPLFVRVDLILKRHLQARSPVISLQ